MYSAAVHQDLTAGQRDFWSKVARKYDLVVDLQIGRKTRCMIRERLAAENSLGTVAEFGCGTGFYTGMLAAKAENVTATDLSPGMLAVAQEHIRAANIKFQSRRLSENHFP